MKKSILALGIVALLGCGNLTGSGSSSNAAETLDRGACFISADDRVLVHRGSGLVDLPSGHAREGESTKTTAVRETEEEVQFAVDADEKLVTADRTDIYDCDVTGIGLAELASDVDDLDFIDLNEVKDSKWAYPSVKDAVIKLME